MNLILEALAIIVIFCLEQSTNCALLETVKSVN